MANTFKLKSKNNIGVSTVGIYTVPAATTTVIIGVTAANVSGQGINVGIGISRGANGDDISILKNVPIPQGSSLEVMQGNKIVVELYNGWCVFGGGCRWICFLVVVC